MERHSRHDVLYHKRTQIWILHKRISPGNDRTDTNPIHVRLVDQVLRLGLGMVVVGRYDPVHHLIMVHVAIFVLVAERRKLLLLRRHPVGQVFVLVRVRPHVTCTRWNEIIRQEQLQVVGCVSRRISARYICYFCTFLTSYA